MIIYMIMSSNHVCAFVPMDAETPSEVCHFLHNCGHYTVTHEGFQLPAHVDISGFFSVKLSKHLISVALSQA